jgi:DNA-binding response OmpR family regulator
MMTGKRVLIVEDEFLVAAMLEDELIDRGATIVGPAASLAEGMRLVENGGFDLAVIDWNLDGEHSTPIAEALREAGVPFVISTGYGMVPPQFAAFPLLAKPYDPAELVRLFGNLLGAG